MPFPEQETLRFTVAGVSKLEPGLSGVYGIHKTSAWIYIGQSDDIKTSLIDHVRGQTDKSNCILGWEPYWVVILKASGPELDKVEGELIEEYDPACNRK